MHTRGRWRGCAVFAQATQLRRGRGYRPAGAPLARPGGAPPRTRTHIRALQHAEPSEAALRNLAAELQETLGALSRLPVPTVAALDGLTLGGGLELALSCTFRVAVDVPGERPLGLPEVKLGLLPGGTGTTVLPALAGLSTSLSMLLSGSPISVRHASNTGVVDAIRPRDEFWSSLLALGDGVAATGGLPAAWSRCTRPLLPRIAFALLDGTAAGRWVTLQLTHRSLRNRARKEPALHRMPAPWVILRTVALAVQGPDQGASLLAPSVPGPLRRGLLPQPSRATVTRRNIDVVCLHTGGPLLARVAGPRAREADLGRCTSAEASAFGALAATAQSKALCALFMDDKAAKRQVGEAAAGVVEPHCGWRVCLLCGTVGASDRGVSPADAAACCATSAHWVAEVAETLALGGVAVEVVACGDGPHATDDLLSDVLHAARSRFDALVRYAQRKRHVPAAEAEAAAARCSWRSGSEHSPLLANAVLDARIAPLVGQPSYCVEQRAEAARTLAEAAGWDDATGGEIAVSVAALQCAHVPGVTLAALPGKGQGARGAALLAWGRPAHLAAVVELSDLSGDEGGAWSPLARSLAAILQRGARGKTVVLSRRRSASAVLLGTHVAAAAVAARVCGSLRTVHHAMFARAGASRGPWAMVDAVGVHAAAHAVAGAVRGDSPSDAADAVCGVAWELLLAFRVWGRVGGDTGCPLTGAEQEGGAPLHPNSQIPAYEALRRMSHAVVARAPVHNPPQAPREGAVRAALAPMGVAAPRQPDADVAGAAALAEVSRTQVAWACVAGGECSAQGVDLLACADGASCPALGGPLKALAAAGGVREFERRVRGTQAWLSEAAFPAAAGRAVSGGALVPALVPTNGIPDTATVRSWFPEHPSLPVASVDTSLPLDSLAALAPLVLLACAVIAAIAVKLSATALELG